MKLIQKKVWEKIPKEKKIKGRNREEFKYGQFNLTH